MSENKWTAGPHPVLFVDSTAGTWKAMVDTDDATWHVRGPDPDNEAHYVSGEATNVDVAEGSPLDLKGRIAAAKKQARAYIMKQIAAGGTKKTKAILEAVRFVRPGDRFRYVGDVWRVKRVGRGPRGVVTMGREVPDPSDRSAQVVLIEEREFPRQTLREMVKI